MEITLPERLQRIFFGFALNKTDAVRLNDVRFVHYTNAHAAVSILKNKEVWMRNSSCMNDFMEVQHGLKCLNASYKTTLEPFLNELFPNLSDEIVVLFDGWTPHFLTNTYLTCISEHMDCEDTIGRLSMWRAYSQETGVALVLNSSPFLNTNSALKIYSSPVAYLGDKEFEKELGQVIDNIRRESDFIKLKTE